MKRFLASLCMVLALVACKEEKKQAEVKAKPVVKIGVSLPLTGNLAYIAEGAKNALQMVLEKWQKKETKYQYEIVFEDDMLKPQQAVLNAHKFIDIDKANVIVSVFGVVDRPIDDIANQSKIISLSCSHGKSEFPEYGINVGSQNEEVYAATLEQLKKSNAKKVVLVGSNSTVSNVLLDYAAEHLSRDGIEVLANEKYAIGERDYRLDIQKFEQKNPDYYLVFGVEPMNTIFARQYWEATGKNNLLSLGAFANISLDVFPPIEGVLSVYMLCDEDFENAFFEKYQHRVETCSPQLYDGLDMIIQAFEKTAPRSGSILPNNADVLKTVKNFRSWDGASGNVKIEQNGIVRPNVDMRYYHNGQWLKIEE